MIKLLFFISSFAFAAYTPKAVTSSTAKLAIESAQVNIAAGPTCTVDRRSGTGFTTSTTANGTGDCTMNFTASFWSSAPYCVVTQNDAGSVFCGLNATPSTSSIRVLCFTDGGTAVNRKVDVICFGAR